MFGEGIINRLHENCSLRDTSNPVRPIIINTIGEWLDNHPPEELMEGVYLQSATGKYLDLFGKDLGVARKLDESDEHYRSRLIYNSLGYLTVNYLDTVYDLQVYSLVDDFNIHDNVLTSDNPYINLGGYMVSADEDTRLILSRKFITGTGVSWLNDAGDIDYIKDSDERNIIEDYMGVYVAVDLYGYFYKDSIACDVHLGLDKCEKSFGLFYLASAVENVFLSIPHSTDARYMFYNCTSLEGAVLELPNVTPANNMFQGCSSLPMISLDLPRATNCSNMFRNCTSLTSVELNLPRLSNYNNCFYGCRNLESITVTIPNRLVSDFISYVTGLSLTNLESFVVNGEPVI